jgi:hypothetical protein
LEQLLLTDDESELVPDELYSSWPLLGETDLHEKHRGLRKTTYGARAMTLDQFIESRSVSTVHLIKLDVDGYECKVLRGAQRLLATQKPVIILELCPYLLRESGESLDELLRVLKAASYRLFDEQTLREVTMDAKVLDSQIADGSGFNVICR